MKQKNKKGGSIACIVIGIVFVLLAAVLFIGDSAYLLGEEARDLNEIAAVTRPQSGTHVKTDSYIVLGNFAETKHYINGIIPAGKEQHFAIVLGSDDMEDVYETKIIVVTVKNKKMIEKLTALATDANADFSDGFLIEGEITHLDSDIEKYYREALSSAGLDDFDYYTVSMDLTKTRASGWALCIFALLSGVLMIAIFVAELKRGKKNAAAMQTGTSYVNPATGQVNYLGTSNPANQPYDMGNGNSGMNQIYDTQNNNQPPV